MNVYADLGTNVDVWGDAPSDTLADRSFAPISEKGIELTNDYEPVVYQANRALMAANAAQEINELQERNHATTAYSTLDCNAVPLFPTFDAQRAVDCGIRRARRKGLDVPPNLVAQPVPPLGYPPQYMMGAPGYYGKGKGPLPPIEPVAAMAKKSMHTAPAAKAAAPLKAAEMADGEVCTKASCNSDVCTCDIPCTCASPETCKCPACPVHNISKSQAAASPAPAQAPPAAAKDGKDASKSGVRAFSKKMVRAAAGSAYDLKHWNELPPKLAGESTGAVLSYALTRDNRGSYLLLWCGVFVLLLALLGLAVGLGCKRSNA